jgi:hypothetical protein
MLTLIEMPYTRYEDEVFEEMVHEAVVKLEPSITEPEEDKDE